VRRKYFFWTLLKWEENVCKIMFMLCSSFLLHKKNYIGHDVKQKTDDDDDAFHVFIFLIFISAFVKWKHQRKSLDCRDMKNFKVKVDALKKI